MRVLLATDGSDDARVATDWLTVFPLPAPAELRVLTVVALPRAVLEVAAVRDFKHSLVAAGHRTAEAARQVLAGRWPRVEVEVVEGDPRDEITRAAEQWPADLLVLGARGLRAITRFLLGSVSTAVVHHTPCPVLVVKGRHAGLRQVVVAVDGSADSMAAARFLAALPLDPALRVRLLGVVEPARLPVGPPEVLALPMLETLDEMARARGAELEAALGRAAAGLEGRVAETERSIVRGAPAEEILRAAAQPGVDLVVVGARGLGPVRRLLMGSVSGRVLHHVDCPVLIVKGPGAR